MSADIRLDELVTCNLCLALLTREGRAQHLEWHARVNARIANLTQQLADILEHLERKE